MSRDKCGAANVAGFMKVVDHLKPQDVIVISVLCLVRNSCGSDSFVSDELITSRAGVRIRIGNTDAEGRWTIFLNIYLLTVVLELKFIHYLKFKLKR